MHKRSGRPHGSSQGEQQQFSSPNEHLSPSYEPADDIRVGKLKVEDAISYMDCVKQQLHRQPQVYKEFLDIMKEYKSQTIDILGVIFRISSLFQGHTDLITGFNKFLPVGYKIELNEATDAVNIYQPGNKGMISTGMSLQSFESTHKRSGRPHGSSQGEQQQFSSRNEHLSPSYEPRGSGQPLEFNHAINYVNKIKNRYHSQPDIYRSFLDILRGYQRQQKHSKEYSSADNEIVEREVYERVASLFKDEPELMVEFAQFLPDVRTSSADDIIVGVSKLEIEDPLSYLDRVEQQFFSQPQVYNEFLDILKEFKSQTIDTPGLISKISSLFQGHEDLIAGFNTFLTVELQIELHEAMDTTNIYQPAEFSRAIDYMKKIKNRYQSQPYIYNSFLDILHDYQKQSKENSSADNKIKKREIYGRVASLFKDEPDLLQGLVQFLLDAGANNGLSMWYLAKHCYGSVWSDESFSSFAKCPFIIRQ